MTQQRFAIIKEGRVQNVIVADHESVAQRMAYAQGAEARAVGPHVSPGYLYADGEFSQDPDWRVEIGGS